MKKVLNNTQEITQLLFDERILPTTGLITVRELLDFCNGSRTISSMSKRSARMEQLIEECEINNVTVFKLLPEPESWLICLDDFLGVNSNEE